MALADFIKGNNLEKFKFDTSKVTEARKLESLNPGDKYLVRAMFYGVSKEDKKPYATIYTDDFYFFAPSYKVKEVETMCKDPEVRAAINRNVLMVNIYQYENKFGKHNSIGWEVCDEV